MYACVPVCIYLCVCLCVYFCICIYQSFCTGRMRHEVNFKQSLYLEFSFQTCRKTKDEEPRQPYYLPFTGGRTIVFPSFLVLEIPGFELVSPSQFFTTVTIIPRTHPPCIFMYICTSVYLHTCALIKEVISPH